MSFGKHGPVMPGSQLFGLQTTGCFSLPAGHQASWGCAAAVRRVHTDLGVTSALTAVRTVLIAFLCTAAAAAGAIGCRCRKFAAAVNPYPSHQVIQCDLIMSSVQVAAGSQQRVDDPMETDLKVCTTSLG